jgi:hypothetical protein
MLIESFSNFQWIEEDERSMLRKISYPIERQTYRVCTLMLYKKPTMHILISNPYPSRAEAKTTDPGQAARAVVIRKKTKKKLKKPTIFRLVTPILRSGAKDSRS